MDADTILRVGDYCEQLLTDPTFQWLSAYFEQNAVGEMLSTKPHETKLRESIYARVTAHHEFLAMVKDFVIKKHEAIEPKETDDIDDPSVHDIYKDIVN